MPECKTAASPIALSTFLDLTRELTIGQRSADTPERLHNFLHRRIFPKLGKFSIELYLRNLEGITLIPQISTKTALRSKVPASLPIYSKLFLNSSGASQPVIIQENDSLPWYLQQTGNVSHLLLPMLDKGNLVGALYVGSRQLYNFDSNYINGLTTLSSIIGSRLKSMETIQHLKYSMRALEDSERVRRALYDISEKAHSSASLEELYRTMHQTVGRLIHAENFIIALVEKRSDGTYYQFPYFADQNDSHFQGSKIKLDTDRKSLTGYLLESKKPLLLTPDNFDLTCIRENIHFQGTRPHSWLGAPFYLDHISGAVITQSYQEIIYTEKDMRLMSFVARHVGDALAKRQAMDELRIAKRKAESAERNKSAFLANMSHEIRTPMNGIIGMTDLALAMELPEKLGEYLGMVRTSATRLLSLVNDILDFSKIEAGKLDLMKAPFNPVQDITDTLNLLRVCAKEKTVELNVEYQDVPQLLIGDSDRLCQIITNLIANGIKFTERGSVSLKVRKTSDQPANPKETVLHFEVKDTGVGIPAEKIDSVFQAFSQIGTTLDSNNRGTGLGLVIAAELVEKMNGRIWIESTPDVGTTFHFTATFSTAPPSCRLSAKRMPPAIHPHPQISEQRNNIALRILLVEDEYINRTLAKTVLEHSACHVITAENGIEALDILNKKENKFDLILMDIQMPYLDGFQTTQKIREQEKTTGCRLPIIAMTAYAVKGDKEKCFEAGMDGYISKPIDQDRLFAEIETILLAKVQTFTGTGGEKLIQV